VSVSDILDRDGLIWAKPKIIAASVHNRFKNRNIFLKYQSQSESDTESESESE
jgi:hypothetical protein